MAMNMQNPLSLVADYFQELVVLLPRYRLKPGCLGKQAVVVCRNQECARFLKILEGVQCRAPARPNRKCSKGAIQPLGETLSVGDHQIPLDQFGVFERLRQIERGEGGLQRRDEIGASFGSKALGAYEVINAMLEQPEPRGMRQRSGASRDTCANQGEDLRLVPLKQLGNRRKRGQ